jgi:hypothetical protein
LDGLFLEPHVIEELLRNWDETRLSPRWSALLATLVASVERDRGNIDARVGIWPDLDEHGPSGRLLYYYLFALQLTQLRELHRTLGVPLDVSDATIKGLARHGETHFLKHGTIGVDAGWWMMVILRGTILQIGSLKFHLGRVGLAPLAPSPWLDPATAREMGAGFVPGDLSVGVHIPARIDLTPAALDATFQRARHVLADVWPTTTRRVATCQSWMMDERLVRALGEDSNIVAFQRRFIIIEPFEEDEENVKYFVFGADAPGLDGLRATTRLQRVVLDVLSSGQKWHNRTGWLDLESGPA